MLHAARHYIWPVHAENNEESHQGLMLQITARITRSHPGLMCAGLGRYDCWGGSWHCGPWPRVGKPHGE